MVRTWKEKKQGGKHVDAGLGQDEVTLGGREGSLTEEGEFNVFAWKRGEIREDPVGTKGEITIRGGQSTGMGDSKKRQGFTMGKFSGLTMGEPLVES